MERLSRFYPEPVILTAVIFLILMGFLNILSIKLAPFILSDIKLEHLRKPAIFLLSSVVGLFIMSAVSHMLNYKKLNDKKTIYTLVGLSLFLLFAVLVKKALLGKEVDRWLVGTSVQPSELSKLIIVLFLAHYVSRKGVINRWSFFGWVVFLVVLHGLFLFLQPDKGMAIFLFAVTVIILWLGCMSPKIYVPILLILASLGVLMLSFGGEYVQRRFIAWKNPMEDSFGSGYQVIQSLLSFINGGFLGQGYGKGVQKLGALTQADTDYALATIGEELGLPGVAFIFVLLGVLLWRLVKVADSATDVFGKLLVGGIAVNIFLSAIINVLMVVNLIPPKGMPLPFISYGTSNLLVNFVSLGIVGAVYKRQLHYRML